jgi:hypothetical protein
LPASPQPQFPTSYNPNSLYYRDVLPHSVAKLYDMAETKALMATYQAIFVQLINSLTKRNQPDTVSQAKTDRQKQKGTSNERS